MHDLRYDAHAPDERTQYDMPTVKRIDPADLRTVQPVDLCTPQARVLDAEARDLRTAGDKIAELVQQVGTLQAVCSELARRVTALEAKHD